MSIVVSTSGRRALLAAALPYLSTLTIRLYNVDHAPLDTDDAADFPQPTFDTYAEKKLTTWPFPYLNANSYAQTNGPTLTWTVGTLGGNDLIYGYCVVDPTGVYIFAEELAGGPVRMRFPGDPCVIAPRFLSGPLA